MSPVLPVAPPQASRGSHNPPAALVNASKGTRVTFQQGLSFAVLAGVMALFVWWRWRYDLVAVTGLLAAVLLGVVPADNAFAGFSNDIVIIVGSALVVSAAVARS